MLLTYILKSIFLKQKIVIIQDQEFLHHHIHNFFKYITHKSFESYIFLITEEIYKNNKKKYKNSMIFNNITILRNLKKLINPKKLFVEKYIINRFLSEYDLEYSYIFLKNEILKAYKLSKAMMDFIDDRKDKNESINLFKISNQLEKIYNIKINPLYLKFLSEIVANYFGATIPSISESFFDFL